MNKQEQLRVLLNEALKILESKEHGGEVADSVTEIVKSATRLAIVTDKPEEAVLDAKILAVSTNILSHCVDSIDANLYAFNTNLFIENILEYISTEDEQSRDWDDWSRLHPLTDSCQLQTSSLEYMLGTFEPGEREPKKRKERAKRTEHKGPTVIPKNVGKGEKQEDGIEDSLQIIMGVLSLMFKRNNKKPVCYFSLVMDPESFGATVENMYHASFLVKDGLISLSLDEDGLPVVSPVYSRGTNKSDSKRAKKENSQCIMALNIQQWEEIIENFNITKAEIPCRGTNAGATPYPGQL